MRTVCANKAMPDRSTVFRWLAKYPEFRDQYARAKEESADALSEDILDIADDATEDVQRSRLRVDARKWLAAKMKPKKYGDRQTIDHGGSDLVEAIKELGADLDREKAEVKERVADVGRGASISWYKNERELALDSEETEEAQRYEELINETTNALKTLRREYYVTIGGISLGITIAGTLFFLDDIKITEIYSFIVLFLMFVFVFLVIRFLGTIWLTYQHGARI